MAHIKAPTCCTGHVYKVEETAGRPMLDIDVSYSHSIRFGHEGGIRQIERDKCRESGYKISLISKSRAGFFNQGLIKREGVLL
jgi:hypothetical protein